ncbi:MAG: glycosyltransferase [Prolixibacteraceae bacterium]|jgi:hypothetical protein|nr:glycosyltransferase [Prolixibacteraceae bacterium]
MKTDSIAPLISVIIPTFNRGKIILDAINSVLNQTYKKYELIVVDDGSTDNTFEVLNNLIANGSITFLKQTNKGPAAARNAGVMISKGEYIAFLDSDDLWLPVYLEIMLNSLSQAPKRVGIVYSNCYNFNPDTKEIFVRYPSRTLHEGNLEKRFLFRRQHVYHGAMMIRKSVFLEIGGYDEYFRRIEDREFNYRVSKICEFHAIKKPLVIIRLHGVENNKDPDDIIEYDKQVSIYDQKMLEKILKDKNITSSSIFLKKRILSRYYYVWGKGLYMNHFLQSSLKYLTKSVFSNVFNFRGWYFLIKVLLNR